MPTARALDGLDWAVLGYLRTQWDALFRLTTIAQAMAALGQQPDDARRLRLGDYLLAHPAVHPAVARWGACTFVLTEDEKLLGSYCVQVGAEGQVGISASNAALLLARPYAEVARGFGVLWDLGLLRGGPADNAGGYRLIPDWRARLGPLAFTFHTVLLQSGERFNVP